MGVKDGAFEGVVDVDRRIVDEGRKPRGTVLDGIADGSVHTELEDPIDVTPVIGVVDIPARKSVPLIWTGSTANSIGFIRVAT